MLHLVADENIPAIESLLGNDVRLTRCNGRSLHAEQLRDADILFVRSVTQVNRALLEGTPVKFIGTATSGTEHIDMQWLRQRGIAFSRAAGANANSVAEYVLSAIAVSGDRLESMMAGGKVGIVGYGPVGQAVYRLLAALGGDCLVHDPWLDPDTLPVGGSLEQALESDLICLHPELCYRQPWPSFHLIGAEELAGLNDGQMLLNASRGAVVDNSALAARLAQPCAPQVVLDVWEGEPELAPALLEQVHLGTAHIAGYSLDAKVLATRMLCEVLEQRGDLTIIDSGAEFFEKPALSVDATCSGVKMVRQLILQRYDIRDDDRQLRDACSHGGTIGMAFDQLRKHYRDRRELAGSIVSAAALDSAGAALVRHLGGSVL